MIYLDKNWITHCVVWNNIINKLLKMLRKYFMNWLKKSKWHKWDNNPINKYPINEFKYCILFKFKINIVNILYYTIGTKRSHVQDCKSTKLFTKPFIYWYFIFNNNIKWFLSNNRHVPFLYLAILCINGIWVLLEQFLNRDILFFAYRHQIFEIVLQAVFAHVN